MAVEFADVHPSADVWVMDVALDRIVLGGDHEGEHTALHGEMDRERSFYQIEILYVFAAANFELVIDVIGLMNRDAGRPFPSKYQPLQSSGGNRPQFRPDQAVPTGSKRLQCEALRWS